MDENKELKIALMDMVNQFFWDKDTNGVLNHSFMSAEENAIDLLERLGLATRVDNGWILNWNEVET